jgi:hypothetical protein
LDEEWQPGWLGRVKFWHCDKLCDADSDQVVLAVEIQEAPSEVLCVHTKDDSRSIPKMTGGVEVRAPSTPRPKSTAHKAKRRPPAPASDTTLARGMHTTQWVAQAYIDSAQGYSRASTPGRGTSGGSTPRERSLPSLTQSSLPLQQPVANSPVSCSTTPHSAQPLPPTPLVSSYL